MKVAIKTKITQEKEKYIAYLNERKLRLSVGRKQSFEAAMAFHGHFSSEELLAQCQHDDRKVSRATLYRTLKEMLEAGIIRKTAFGDKHDNYEHLYDEKPHHHARCLRCGNLIELPDLNEDKLYEPILDQKGFQVVGHEMHFYGICNKCQ